MGIPSCFFVSSHGEGDGDGDGTFILQYDNEEAMVQKIVCNILGDAVKNETE